MNDRTYLLTIEHTPEGPRVQVDRRMPREMMLVLLAASAQNYLDDDEREAPAMLEDAARFMRDNPGAFVLKKGAEPLIVTPRTRFPPFRGRG